MAKLNGLQPPTITMSLLFRRSFACLLLGWYTNALTSTNTITVKPVSSSADVFALADLRYSEWIDATDTSSPTLGAFRMATEEITAERKEEGAVVFLARVNGRTVAGAAELSPIELDQCWLTKEDNKCLYVTDVVTAQSHRRMGIGNALMEAVAKEASKKNVSWLLLHVKQDNEAALGFYKKAGYCELPQYFMKGFDKERLAENAGAIGQILLGKTVPKGRTASGGFGSMKIKKTKTKRSK